MNHDETTSVAYKKSANDAAVIFFREMVEPTVAEFLSVPDDRRRGCLACLCLASMAEHFFYARPAAREGFATTGAFKQKIAKNNAALGLVFGIANATKHVVRLPGRPGFEDVSAQPITCGNLRAGWPINGNQVLVEFEGGGSSVLSQPIKAAEDFWRSKLLL